MHQRRAKPRWSAKRETFFAVFSGHLGDLGCACLSAYTAETRELPDSTRKGFDVALIYSIKSSKFFADGFGSSGYIHVVRTSMWSYSATL